MSEARIYRIVIGAIFGFVATVVIFSAGLLIYPMEKVAGVSEPGFNSHYLGYVFVILVYGSILGFIVGVPIGAIGGALMPMRKPKQHETTASSE